VSAPGAMKPADGGRSNGVRPSLSSDFLTSYLMLSAGVGTPRDFMAPNTCDGTYCCGEALQPDVGPATSNCRGAGTATAVVLVLLSVAVVLLALLLRLGRAVRPRFRRSFALNSGNVSRPWLACLLART